MKIWDGIVRFAGWQCVDNYVVNIKFIKMNKNLRETLTNLYFTELRKSEKWRRKEAYETVKV